MKVVILAGGLGTRISEETTVKPKPMIEIGDKPILWHIMKHYTHYGFQEFFLALGYKGDEIKRYFMNYADLDGSLTLRLKERQIERHGFHPEDWTIHLMETGHDTNTGGRLHKLREYLRDGTFMATYGDGVSNVELDKLLAFHRAHGKLATVTAVRPPARFGGLEFEGDKVVRFAEKPQIGEGWINGGFFILEPGVLDYIEGDETHWEREPLERLAAEGQLMAYRHENFWQCMDTLRDKRLLEQLWQSGEAPWKVWE
jgi:glucose-1-phosphate cytidylyltransferase